MSPPQVAQLSPHKERFPSPEPSFHNLQVPWQRSPLSRFPWMELPSREMPHPQSPVLTISQEFPVNGHIHPLSPSPYVLLDSQKGAPQRSSHKERCSRSGALHSSFGFPGIGALLEAPCMEPLERAILHPKSPFIQLSKSPVNEPSSRFPKSRAPMQRDC
jgi:hypothetical protein